MKGNDILSDSERRGRKGEQQNITGADVLSFTADGEHRSFLKKSRQVYKSLSEDQDMDCLRRECRLEGFLEILINMLILKRQKCFMSFISFYVCELYVSLTL